ncbi:oxidoreductase [Verrucomicrobia bacterium LW23]|nr:oxidoreductase [Verrucomicrobia bacterium LW23]
MPASPSQTIVITGVTRGLGLAMAEGFIARGHKVCGCGRSADAIAALATRFPAHLFHAVDVTDAAAVKDWADKVIAAAGAPTLLINNAALINASAPLWRVPAEEFSQVIDVNIKGTAYVVAAYAPAMIAKRAGVIVNFSSGWGRSTSPEVAPYCATKWAIEGLTQALSQELPRGMAAVALNPGIIDTDMLRSTFGGGSGGYPAPAEWAKSAVPFLLSLTARHNGQALDVG